MQIKKKIASVWEHKVGNNANIANLVCLWKTRMNHDKVQKWSGYHKWFLSGNKHITSGSNTKSISITASGENNNWSHEFLFLS